MNPMEALQAWADACNHTGIRWFLYKEALVCANGYHAFPESLPNAQIAVRAKDLPDLVEYVFPALPHEWKLDAAAFVRGSRLLVFKIKNVVMLEIHVLYGVENEGAMAKFSGQLRKQESKVGRKLTIRKLVNTVGKKLLGGLYTKTIGKLIGRSSAKLVRKAFKALVALAGTSNENAECYCDAMTSKKPVLFGKSLFNDTLSLTCTQTAEDPAAENIVKEYPVFSGYRSYLEAVYGDYENGLFDEIGLGLTVEEKEELRQHQARCFEALTFLQSLSKEFGLRYYLIAGSVLGALRHGGFIPWDDDIDIGIRVEEIENFEAVVKANFDRLPEGFTLEQSGADNPYPRMFSKICFNGRCCIDLWPLIPTYREGFKANYLWYFGKIITKVHYQKIGYEVTKFQKIVKIADMLMSDKKVMKMARNNERKYANMDTPAYINLYSIYKRHKETMKREWLDEEATAIFNGLEVPVVGNTKLYLTHLYGKYMSFPAPWKRVSRHVTRF